MSRSNKSIFWIYKSDIKLGSFLYIAFHGVSEILIKCRNINYSLETRALSSHSVFMWAFLYKVRFIYFKSAHMPQPLSFLHLAQSELSIFGAIHSQLNNHSWEVTDKHSFPGFEKRSLRIVRTRSNSNLKPTTPIFCRWTSELYINRSQNLLTHYRICSRHL